MIELLKKLKEDENAVAEAKEASKKPDLFMMKSRERQRSRRCRS